VSKPESGHPDSVLIQQAQAGDGRAREALFRRYAGLVNGLAYRLLGSDTDLDDLVQESFAQALTCLNRLQNIETFPTWLATIVVRTSHKMLRRRRLMARFGLWRPPEIDWEQVRSHGASTEQLVELRALYRHVHAMPADLRIPLVLKHVEDKSLQEIATLLDTSIATVKRRITKAQKILEAAVRDERDLTPPESSPVPSESETHRDDAPPRVASQGRRHG
jgi:RNA polymerase sigma-70 factor (ECF subfamily)